MEMSDFITINEVKERIEEQLINDQLFIQVQQREGHLNELFAEELLTFLDLNKWYSTVEVADFFQISDSKLRYYIKPLIGYILPENTPSTSSAYRLNYISIIKLKMVLLLKDEFKVAGLQTLIGYGRGRVVDTSKERAVAFSTNQDDRVEKLESMLKQILETGLFEVKEVENQQPKLGINLEAIQKLSGSHLIGENIEDKLNDLHEAHEKDKQELVSKIEELNQKTDVVAEIEEAHKKDKEELIKKIEELNQKTDIAALVKRRREITKRAEEEASSLWDQQHKGIFKRLRASEYEKRKFINDHVEKALEKEGL